MDPRIEKIIKLPAKQKILIVAVIVAAEIAGAYFLALKPKQELLTQKLTTLDGLKGQIVELKRVAANLPRFKAEYEDLQKKLEAALTELPNQKEIPSLLTAITSAGKGAGLDFLTFRPKGEEPKDFYALVPVDIVVAGTFYNVMNFFNAVSALPRIVNIGNVNFDVRTERGRTVTKVSCLATTFRFLDRKEIKDEKKPAKK
jgi:type IV pilus assembly protein PilO